ncbi:MAG TPA: hypothetical protein VHB50_13480, partial [Bryobacteraceae bacterium]|nr:hypothetical protein [Bryobacteraceae bacterium]
MSSVSAVSGSSGYFRWQPAENSPAVLLSEAVMRVLRDQVTALPTRGSEIGGALLGNRDHATGEFTIEEFQPIEIEHAAGPAYILSESDVQLWRAAVTELRQKSPAFIGIYRSQARPGFHVTPEDCAMVERLLPFDKGVLLLVKPLSEKEAVGAMFLCDGGAVIDEAVNGREFPLAAPAKPHTAWKRIALPLSALAAGIAAAIVFHYAPGENPLPPLPPPSGLHLRTTRSGGNVRLNWDPA